jgi:hypothetical protein
MVVCESLAPAPLSMSEVKAAGHGERALRDQKTLQKPDTMPSNQQAPHALKKQ